MDRTETETETEAEPKPRNILAIDTTTEACSVALNLRGTLLQRSEIAPNGHSRLVLGMVESLLREAGLDLRDLDALAVDVGPGSFTGVRIGIGVAQGLAYGAGCKVVPVGSLEALACGVFRDFYETASDPVPGPVPEIVLAAIDAHMGQIYYACYGLDGRPSGLDGRPSGLDGRPSGLDGGSADRAPEKNLRVRVAPTLGTPESLRCKAGRGGKGGKGMVGMVGTGSGWERYGAVMGEALHGRGAPAAEWRTGCHPEAAAVSRLAAARGGAVSPLDLTAAYIRDEVAEKPRP